MINKFLFLLLFIVLLPTCAGLEVPSPGAPAPREVKPSEPGLYQKAEASYRAMAYRQAYQQYSYYLELYPQGPHAMDARLREAEILGVLGDWQGSLKHYQDILSHQPHPDVSLKARYGIGRAYFKLGEYQQASQVLDNLTAADMPRSMWFSTQALLAEIALKQKNMSRAFNHLRLAAQDLSSGDPEWFEDLKTRILDKADTPELEQMANLYPHNPLTAAILLRLARLNQDAGRTNEAAKWLETLKARFPSSPEAAAAEGFVTGRKMVLASLLPLSGQYSGIGTKVQRGMELAVKKSPMKVIFRDTGSNSETAATLTRELSKNADVLAIVGPVSSAVAQSAAEAAQTSSLPIITLSQKDGITRTGDLVFQAFITPRQQVRALVRYAISKGIKRFTILYPDSSYGRAFLQSFEEEVTAQGREVASRALYSPGSQAFTPTLSAMAESLNLQEGQTSSAHAVFLPDDAATVSAIAASIKETPLKGSQLLGTNLLHNANISAAQTTALQGIVFPDAFFAGDPNPAVQKFIAAYRQQYGAEPDYLATQGYVVLRLLAQLAESAQALNRTSLPQQLLALKAVPNLPWFKGFNSQREEEGALYLLTYTGEGIQMVSPRSGTEPVQ